MTTTMPKSLRLPAWREKDKSHYEVAIGERHRRVLEFLATRHPLGSTDREITFGLEMHMAAARRCELRDMGAVQRGRSRHQGSSTWRVTRKGLDLLAQLNETKEDAK